MCEVRYEGLRYTTFVGGGTRGGVVREVESALDAEKAQGPEWREGVEGSSVGEVGTKMQVGGEEWLKELERAIGEVILIAKDRLKKLGLA